MLRIHGELTDRERTALDAFRALAREDGMPPTIVAVGGRMNLAHPNHAKRYLDALVAAGHLERAGAGSRAYRLPEREARTACGVPLYGRVAAGKPIQCASEPVEWVDVRAEMGGSDAVLYEVLGDSMIDDGIKAGDLISVVKRPPVSGETVVCRFAEEGATLKVYRDYGRRGLWLQPRNSAHKPRKLDAADDPHIEGVFVALLRSSSRLLKAAVRRRRP